MCDLDMVGDWVATGQDTSSQETCPIWALFFFLNEKSRYGHFLGLFSGLTMSGL